MRSRFLATSTLLLLAACGGAPPPTEVPPPPIAVATSAPEVAAEPSPATEPRGLLVLGRWKAPLKGADEVLKAFGSPVSVEALFAGTGDLGKVVNVDASVDAAVILDPESTDDDPKVLAAFSVPLRSFDDARALAEKEGPVTPLTGGAVRLSGKTFDKSGVCDLSPSTGDAAARLVCGPKGKDVDALRPWLTRGLAPTTTGNDLVISTRAAPIRDRYLATLRSKGSAAADEARGALVGKNVSDPELLAVPGIVLDESLHFLEDLDSVDLRVAFAPTPPELVAAGTLRFGAKSSWITRVITSANDHPGPPPALFWHVPRDASSATWGRGTDPHDFDGVRRVLHKALAEVLSKVPLPDADKGALSQLIDTAPRSGGAWVSSQGGVKTKSKPTPKGAPVDVKALTSAALGWTVTGTEAPAAEYVTWFKQVVDVYGRSLRVAHDFLAITGQAKSPQEDPLRLAPTVKILSSPGGWPKGTVAFDVTINTELAELLGARKKGPSKADPKKPSVKPLVAKGNVVIRFAIVPDGDKTWMGLSADLDELKNRMKAVITNAPADGTIASREGLDRLRAAGQTWGGFFTFGDLAERAVQALEQDKGDTGATARAAFSALPNHGRTPILLVGTATNGDRPANSAEVHFEAGTLSDIAALTTFLLARDKGKAAAPAKP